MVCVFNVTALCGGDCVSVIFMFFLVKCICSSLPSTASLIQVFALALLVFPNVFFFFGTSTEKFKFGFEVCV